MRTVMVWRCSRCARYRSPGRTRATLISSILWVACLSVALVARLLFSPPLGRCIAGGDILTPNWGTAATPPIATPISQPRSDGQPSSLLIAAAADLTLSDGAARAAAAAAASNGASASASGASGASGSSQGRPRSPPRTGEGGGAVPVLPAGAPPPAAAAPGRTGAGSVATAAQQQQQRQHKQQQQQEEEAAAAETMKDSMSTAVQGDLDAFGIQLYTLRDEMPKDPKGVLKKVADYGYHQIESYEGEQGMFWGMSNKEFKAYMDELGMKIVSSHVNINEDLERKAAEAAEIGMDYIICPYVGPQTSMDAWKGVTDKFNTAGEVCRKEGIQFAYHNHAYSFKAFSGMIPHDFLMDNTDPDLVKHEMDIYWVITGGADPIEYLKKYPNRFVYVK